MSGGEQGNCAGCCPAPLFPLTQGRGKSARGAPSCPYMVLPSLTATRNESVNDRGMAGTQAIPMLRSSKGMKPGVSTPGIGTHSIFALKGRGRRKKGICGVHPAPRNPFTIYITHFVVVYFPPNHRPITKKSDFLLTIFLSGVILNYVAHRLHCQLLTKY